MLQVKSCTLCQKIHTWALLKKGVLTPKPGHQADRGTGPSAVLAWADDAGTRGTLPRILASHHGGGGERTPRKPSVNVSCQLGGMGA